MDLIISPTAEPVKHKPNTFEVNVSTHGVEDHSGVEHFRSFEQASPVAMAALASLLETLDGMLSADDGYGAPDSHKLYRNAPGYWSWFHTPGEKPVASKYAEACAEADITVPFDVYAHHSLLVRTFTMTGERELGYVHSLCVITGVEVVFYDEALGKHAVQYRL